MKLSFKKFQGTGNDFVLFDALSKKNGIPDLKVSLLCDRHFGVGGDGVIILEPTEEADFYMRFWNPDGSESFCGNGSRCAVKAYTEAYGKKGEELRFEAIDGLHSGKFLKSKEVEVSIGSVKGIDTKGDHSFVDTGSPHVIRPVDDIDGTKLNNEAAYFRDHPVYREGGGTNVNLVKVLKKGVIQMRTFERGVEQETLSCGSGVTAAALWAADSGHAEDMCEVRTRGGILNVHFTKSDEGFEAIRLTGPAEQVFEGIWETS